MIETTIKPETIINIGKLKQFLLDNGESHISEIKNHLGISHQRFGDFITTATNYLLIYETEEKYIGILSDKEIL